MDAKSLAKSKRAHSLHHSKKPHSIQKAKAASGGPSDDAGSGSKPLGKQAKERARQSGLPSNWDRYEEEYEGSDEQFGEGLSKSSDAVLPKSKGADYRHLIAEAQSQYQSNSRLDSDNFLSLEDIFPGDFKIGVGPILSARGEGILSWIGDENFIVEDETTGNHEQAAFLSLNLNALADQLEKVNLSERLYIEPDLLPPDLAEDHRSTTIDTSESDQVQTGATEARTDFSEGNKVAKLKTDTLSSQSAVNVQTKSNSLNQGPDLWNQSTVDLNSKADTKISQSTASNSSSFLAPSKKVSTFEAKSAEAELDMLLDAFSETKFLDSPEKIANAPQAQPQFAKTAPTSATKPSDAKLDDFLDDLLEKTSNSNEIPPSSSSQSVSKSKVLDDFDSWLDTI